ncbi:MAG TPA: response regulator [Gemmataceae bacterium]|nr:response regulator [Gemmataceae bacterium]
MNRTLRIAVADDEPRMLQFYREVLPMMGHEVVCTALNGAELIEQCRSARPDLVISDIKMPDMDGIDASKQLAAQEAVPIIMVTAHDDPELLERAGATPVLAYLVKPIKRQDLQPAIVIAMRRFEELQTLQKDATDLRQALQDRKIIERAKGVLMKRTGRDEASAFQSMQKLARDKNRKLVQVAEMILTAEEAFGLE